MSMIVGLLVSAGLIGVVALLVQQASKSHDWQSYATNDEDFKKIQERLGTGKVNASF